MVAKQKIYLILCLITIIFTQSNGAVPGGDAGAYLELAPSISTSALAGACWTFCPEPSAIFTNPANLYNLSALSGEVSYEKFPLDVSRYSFSASFPIGNFRLSAGMLQHSINEIQGRDEQGNLTTEFGYNYISYSFGGAYGIKGCLLYTSPSPRDLSTSRMPSSA